jgi:acetyltransferase-like isoleucine patch superfamily enzyme
MAEDLPPLPVPPRGVRRALIELDRVHGAARRASLSARTRLGALRVGAGLDLALHPTVVVGHHVVIECWHGTRNGVEIGPGVRLGDHTWISMRGGRLRIGARTDVRRGVNVHCSGVLEVGEEVLLSTGMHVHCANAVSIGDWTIIGEYSTIVDSRHLIPTEHEPVRHTLAVGRVAIGRNAWFGAKVTAGSDVSIGDRVIIGAGAVVTEDVPAGTLAAGVPARVVRSLEASEGQGDDAKGSGGTGTA